MISLFSLFKSIELYKDIDLLIKPYNTRTEKGSLILAAALHKWTNSYVAPVKLASYASNITWYAGAASLIVNKQENLIHRAPEPAIMTFTLQDHGHLVECDVFNNIPDVKSYASQIDKICDLLTEVLGSFTPDKIFKLQRIENQKYQAATPYYIKEKNTYTRRDVHMQKGMHLQVLQPIVRGNKILLPSMAPWSENTADIHYTQWPQGLKFKELSNYLTHDSYTPSNFVTAYLNIKAYLRKNEIKCKPVTIAKLLDKLNPEKLRVNASSDYVDIFRTGLLQRYPDVIRDVIYKKQNELYPYTNLGLIACMVKDTKSNNCVLDDVKVESKKQLKTLTSELKNTIADNHNSTGQALFKAACIAYKINNLKDMNKMSDVLDLISTHMTNIKNIEDSALATTLICMSIDNHSIREQFIKTMKSHPHSGYVMSCAFMKYNNLEPVQTRKSSIYLDELESLADYRLLTYMAGQAEHDDSFKKYFASIFNTIRYEDRPAFLEKNRNAFESYANTRKDNLLDVILKGEDVSKFNTLNGIMTDTIEAYKQYQSLKSAINSIDQTSVCEVEF